ncbi:MAG TPA: glycosyltransferase family 25 protein [Phnomibacter sp.]|nr:glycosyltransferase family 25 protein [Phnomibacter sp.]
MQAHQQFFDALNQFFDKIYVITIERAKERRDILEPQLAGLQYSYLYGMDKTLLEKDTDLLHSYYDEQKAKLLHRYNKPMVIGHVACSISHRMVYEDMVRNNYKNALIFEDDVVPDWAQLHHIPEVLAQLPADWDMLYWGFDKNGDFGWSERMKQLFYHGLSVFKTLKWNHTMIGNLHAKPYSSHLKKAGYHDLLHAYSLSLDGAKKMIELQSPIALNADPAVAYAVSNGWLKAFVTQPMIFLQEVQVHPETYHSFINE